MYVYSLSYHMQMQIVCVCPSAPGGLVYAEVDVAEQRVGLVVSEGHSFNLHYGPAQRPCVREGEREDFFLFHRLHHRLSLDRLDATLNLDTQSNKHTHMYYILAYTQRHDDVSYQRSSLGVVSKLVDELLHVL